jgi:hypothetical protein
MQPGERREWVSARLDNWARWLQQSSTGSLGYPKQVPFMRLGGQSASCDNVIPVDAIDAARTHRAVQALRAVDVAVWLTVHCAWVGDPRAPSGSRREMSKMQIALLMNVTDRTVRNRIDVGLTLVAQALSHQR